MRGFQFLFFSVFVTGVGAKGTAQDSCLQIVDKASQAPEKERAYEVYTQCHLHRPTEGVVGESDANEDCTQFTHLYQVATHYSKDFSKEEFCSTLKSDATADSGDHLVAEHGSCVTTVEQILASKEVGDAAKKSCLRLRQGATDEECGHYAAQISAAAGQAEASQICDKVVRKGTATQGIEEQHFVYSCVQYADNLIAKNKNSSPEQNTKVKAQVVKSCKSHTPKDQQSFCVEYSEKIHDRAGRDELTTFCDAQYKKMHAAPADATPPAPASKPAEPAKPAPPKEAAPPQEAAAPKEDLTPVDGTFERKEEAAKPENTVDFHAVPQPAAEKKPEQAKVLVPAAGDCEKHMNGIQKLKLPAAKKEKITELQCREKYKGSQQACSKLAQMVVSGNVAGGCSLLRPAQKKGPDMMSMCQKTLDQVLDLDLEGEAFRQTAADVCGEQLSSSLGNSPKVAAGCKFFAGRLSTAYTQGSFDKSSFCSKLVGGPAAKKQSRATPVVVASDVPKVPTSLHVVSKKKKTLTNAQLIPHQDMKVSTHRVNGRKKRESLVSEGESAENPKDDDDAVAAPGEESFLNNFLDQYDADQEKQKQAKVAEVQRKADKLFGDDDADAAAPAKKGKAAALVGEDIDDQSADNILADAEQSDLGADADAPAADAAPPAPPAPPVKKKPAPKKAALVTEDSDVQSADIPGLTDDMPADVSSSLNDDAADTTSAAPEADAKPVEASAEQAPPPPAAASDSGDVDSLVSGFLSQNS